ncbi:unnamed protein product, partial [Mesorhabditis belari]|uniref:Uncharacterized protein n=1 Tax=Mesorhabditis belari TaxID=2138241 RepID=A0AAF3EIC8_9BILA
MDVESIAYLAIYEKCYKEMCDERLKEIVEIFRTNYYIWPEYVDSLKYGIMLLVNRLSQNKVSPFDFKTIYGERCDFLVDFLLKALPQELNLWSLNNEEIRFICRNYELYETPSEIETIPNCMKIKVTSVAQLIYGLSNVILTNPDVGTLWINDFVVYTSPESVVIKERREQIEAIWRTRKGEVEFLKELTSKWLDSKMKSAGNSSRSIDQRVQCYKSDQFSEYNFAF